MPRQLLYSLGRGNETAQLGAGSAQRYVEQRRLRVVVENVRCRHRRRLKEDEEARDMHSQK